MIQVQNRHIFFSELSSICMDVHGWKILPVDGSKWMQKSQSNEGYTIEFHASHP